MIKAIVIMQAQFEKMCQTGKLFRSKIDNSQLWELYLNNFNDTIFRDPESSTHNCRNCHNFIRRYGNIISFDENLNVMTLYDALTDEKDEFYPSFKAMSDILKAAPAVNIFFESKEELKHLLYESIVRNQDKFKLGIDRNVKRYTKEEAEKFGVVKPNELRTFEHLHLYLPKEFVVDASVDTLMSEFRANKDVFKRGMEEISLDTLKLVRDLIKQNSLLDGQTHLYKVERMIILKAQFDTLPVEKRDNWCWIASYKNELSKFKNELIGVLSTDLSLGVDLNKACKDWNKRVDPINYMKATAPITQKQIEEAKAFVINNGYTESFNRRFATMDDIKASEILHLNSGNSEIKNVSIFDNVKATNVSNKKAEFKNVEEISIEKFLSDVLPHCTSVEAFLTNSMERNLVSLTTSNVKDSKPIFKWNNNYSWTFNGNIAGKSEIKSAVKERGGQTEADIRISIHFPGTSDDYDLHVAEPTGHVYYGNRRCLSSNGGMLDLDAQGCDGLQPPEKRIENVVYKDKNKMRSGIYSVYVSNYSGTGVHTKFTAEIEIEGEITTLELTTSLRRNAEIAKIHCTSDKSITLEVSKDMTIISSNTISKKIYNLDTNKFHKVKLICLSPNHWDDQTIGNKFYMFMLENCICPNIIRTFHNENLNSELLQHRKVMEVLGATNGIESSSNDQLSGLGFNATVKDELLVKVKGSFQRMLKIKF